MQTPTEGENGGRAPRWVARIADFFGLKRNLVVLLIAIFVIGAGEELWMRFVPKYLLELQKSPNGVIENLAKAAFIIGLFDALRTLLGAIYAYPGGLLVDFWGHRRAFITFNIFSVVGYSLVLLIPHWGAVIAGMFLFLSWTCFSLPATFSLVGEALAANRYAMGIGIQMVIRRLPIMFAPILGGILIDRFGVVDGVRMGLTMSILLSTATIFVQRQLRDEPREKAEVTERWSFWRSLREFNSPMRRLLLSDILIRFCERIPFAWAVIFAMDYIGMSAKQVGVLTMIEVLVASLCIIPASHFADKYRREPFVIVTFLMFTIFPLALMISRNFNMLAVAFAIRGLKEFGDTSRKALIISYSAPERRGQMVGAYYFVRDLIVSSAALLGAYLWSMNPKANFLGAAVFGIAGTILYFRSTREMREEATPVVLFRGRKPPS